MGVTRGKEDLHFMKVLLRANKKIISNYMEGYEKMIDLDTLEKLASSKIAV